MSMLIWARHGLWDPWSGFFSIHTYIFICLFIIHWLIDFICGMHKYVQVGATHQLSSSVIPTVLYVFEILTPCFVSDPMLVLTQSLSLGLELAVWAELAGPKALRISLSTLPQCCDYKMHVTSSGVLHGPWVSKPRSLYCMASIISQPRMCCSYALWIVVLLL